MIVLQQFLKRVAEGSADVLALLRGGYMAKNTGAGRYGTQRGAFERNKTKIFKTQTVCGICGKPVDFSLRYPHPLAATVDHIIPIAKGGHPSDLDNMQLAHWTCNRQKSDKLREKVKIGDEDALVSNRMLPHSIDWMNFHRLQ